MVAAIIISIAVLLIVIYAISVNKKHKKAKEELARQRQIKLEAERKKRLEEQTILKGKNRILMSPTYADYIAVEEKICDIELPLPKVSSNLYFVGEVVDVTGWLGGYNFQWAWSSGWAAGQVA